MNNLLIYLSFCTFLFMAAAEEKSVWDFRGKSTEEHMLSGEAPNGLFGTSVVTTDLISIVGSPGKPVDTIHSCAC